MMEEKLNPIPTIGDKNLGMRLVTALALQAALNGGPEEFADLDEITVRILEESIMAYALSCGFEAEA
tara:strand:- start:210 stop:410 length:201 start_codon:yes stop_codon:yes gene_type:complete